VIENGPVLASCEASATAIVIDSWMPTSFSPGVPVMRPLLGSMLAHGGRFPAVKRNASPSGSEATG
jgi:hypothetical protein